MTGEDLFNFRPICSTSHFKHSLMAVHLSADLGASADMATGLATTFYLVIW
jgi:hypothetical protein